MYYSTTKFTSEISKDEYHKLYDNNKITHKKEILKALQKNSLCTINTCLENFLNSPILDNQSKNELLKQIFVIKVKLLVVARPSSQYQLKMETCCKMWL